MQTILITQTHYFGMWENVVNSVLPNCQPSDLPTEQPRATVVNQAIVPTRQLNQAIVPTRQLNQGMMLLWQLDQVVVLYFRNILANRTRQLYPIQA
jgi:hypothetical protein